MNNASTFDRLVLCGLALFVITSFLANFMVRAVRTIVSRTVETAKKASALFARTVMNGARAALSIMI